MTAQDIEAHELQVIIVQWFQHIKSDVNSLGLEIDYNAQKYHEL